MPPSAINWNDADDNNAFHAKTIVMDLDGTISTEVAIFKKKEEYDDIITMGLPLSNDGKPIPSVVTNTGGMIPKGAKNVEVAKDFLKYMIQPEVCNEYLKVGLGRNVPAMKSIVENDPWWKEDPHRKAYVEQTLLSPTVSEFFVFNPAYAQCRNEHTFATGLGRRHPAQHVSEGRGRKGDCEGEGDFREISNPELRDRLGRTGAPSRLGRSQPFRADGHRAQVSGTEQAFPATPAVANWPRWPAGRPLLGSSDAIWALAFVLPYIAVLLAFVLVPLGYGLWMGSGPALYSTLWSDPIYTRTLVNTLIFVGLSVNVKMVLALLLSGFFMRRRRWIKGLLVVFMLPWVTSAIPAFISFHWMLSSEQGFINSFLRQVVGVEGPLWLSNPRLALGANIVA